MKLLVDFFYSGASIPWSFQHRTGLNTSSLKVKYFLFALIFGFQQIWIPSLAWGQAAPGGTATPISASAPAVDAFGAGPNGKIIPSTNAAGAPTDAAGAAAINGPPIDFIAHFIGTPFPFIKTQMAIEKHAKSSQAHVGATCSKATTDVLAVAGIGANAAAGAAGGSAGASQSASGVGQTVGATTMAIQAKCQSENAARLAESSEVQAAASAEKGHCDSFATEDAQIVCKEMCGPADLAAYPLCMEGCFPGNEARNLAECTRVYSSVQAKENTIMAVLKAHGAEILGILGAVGAAAGALASSSDKKTDEFTTTPKAKSPSNPTPTPSPTPNPPEKTATANTPSGGNLSSGAYCQGGLKPLECFVTPSCSLKCVSEKFGVPNYAGMDHSTTRIGKDGRPVEDLNAKDTSGMNAGRMGGSNSTGGGALNGLAMNSSNAAKTKTSDNTAETAKGHGDTTTEANLDAASFGAMDSSSAWASGSDQDEVANKGRRGPALNAQGPGALGPSAMGGNNDMKSVGPFLGPNENLFKRITYVLRSNCVFQRLNCE